MPELWDSMACCAYFQTGACSHTEIEPEPVCDDETHDYCDCEPDGMNPEPFFDDGLWTDIEYQSWLTA